MKTYEMAIGHTCQAGDVILPVENPTGHFIKTEELTVFVSAIVNNAQRFKSYSSPSEILESVLSQLKSIGSSNNDNRYTSLQL
jgi:hypothetical protein